MSMVAVLFAMHSMGAQPIATTNQNLEVGDLQLRLLPARSEARDFSLFNLIVLNRGEKNLSLAAQLILETPSQKSGEPVVNKVCPVFVEIQAGQEGRWRIPCRVGDYQKHTLKVLKVYPFLLNAPPGEKIPEE